MKVVIPADQAATFTRLIPTDKYRKDERDYKWAVHLVLAALLSERNSSREDFAVLISDVFGKAMPDLDALALSPDDQAFVKAAVPGGGGLRGAMGNLGGGKWGLAQFAWIPRAVEFELGSAIADAFRAVIDGEQPLAQRVDAFRDQLYEACQALERKGGFLPDWHLFRVSLSFVAVVLAGYDPARYTFYSKGALRYGYEQYAPGSDWPKGTMGTIYEGVCDFIQSVEQVLKAKGAPVRDLIDAQSFIWVAFRESKEDVVIEAPKPPAPGSRREIDLDVVAKDLAKRVYWPLDRAQRLVGLVERWGRVLFQGPPGTGKTFVAEALGELLTGGEDGRVKNVSFHPSYAYEDFVEGIRPVLSEGKSLAYEVRPGVLLDLADTAKKYPDDQFFLIIDELNRANLPRVFGELLYAIEYRGPEHTFHLPYSGTENYLPDNISIIAAMNTADRSIALVDAAIRRRFRHVQFAPDPDVLKAWLTNNGLADMADHAAGRLVALNDQVELLLDSDRLIGHTYLMRDDLRKVGLGAVWEEDIEPVLREHLFNQREELPKLQDVFLAPQ